MMAVGLLGQQFHLVIGRQAVNFIQVAVLLNDLERLRAYAACGTQNSYLSFHIVTSIYSLMVRRLSPPL